MNDLPLKFTSYPALPTPSRDEIILAASIGGEVWEGMIEWHKQHENAVYWAKYDPLNYGVRFASWEHVLRILGTYNECLGLGGNGSGKTRLECWLGVQCLIRNPGCKFYWFAQDETASVKIQQRTVYEYLPPQFRMDHTTPDGGYVRYKMKTGFTENSFILDMGDGSELREGQFFTYSQYEANQIKFEGYAYGSKDPQWKEVIDGKEYTINCGAALDEFIKGGGIYDSIFGRVSRSGASMFVGVTPIHHLTPFFKDKIKDSRIVKTIETDSQLFDHKTEPNRVEWVREKMYKHGENGIGIVYLPTQHNVFGTYDAMRKANRHKALRDRLMRFHGIPDATGTVLSPKFSNDVNVLGDKPNQFGMSFPKDTSDSNKYTTYQVVDPAGARNDYAIWAHVDANGDVYVEYETPESEKYGEWAIMGEKNWMPGPAQKKHGWGINGYVNNYLDIEKSRGWTVFERIGDSRGFARPNAHEGTLFDEYAEYGLHFTSASGKVEEYGDKKIDNYLDYNVDIPVDLQNKPRLFVHERCEHLIGAMYNYERSGKYDEAWKDPRDALRYLLTSNGGDGPEHYKPDAFKTKTKTRGYGS